MQKYVFGLGTAQVAVTLAAIAGVLMAGCGYGGPCYTNSPTKSFNQYAVSRSRTKKAKRA